MIKFCKLATLLILMNLGVSEISVKCNMASFCPNPMYLGLKDLLEPGEHNTIKQSSFYLTLIGCFHEKRKNSMKNEKKKAR